MVSVAKVIKTVGSTEAKEIASKAVELLKAKGTKKLKKAEDLVKEEKKLIQIKDKEIEVGKSGVNVTISKEDLAKKILKLKKKRLLKK